MSVLKQSWLGYQVIMIENKENNKITTDKKNEH